MGIIPRADQEHLGCVSTEHPASGGLLPEVRPEGAGGGLKVVTANRYLGGFLGTEGAQV